MGVSETNFAKHRKSFCIIVWYLLLPEERKRSLLVKRRKRRFEREPYLFVVVDMNSLIEIVFWNICPLVVM